MKYAKLLIALLVLTSWTIAQEHLLISEVAKQPNSGEFIEIFNPTAAPVALDNYYLADYNEYYKLVNNEFTSVSSDFMVQFPAGTVIAPNEVLVIALEGNGLPGVADFEIESTDPAVPDMVPLYVTGSAGLTNSSEMVVLFVWDGSSDLVQDVDYLTWGGSTDNFADKTGIAIDGPDPDSDPSTYLPDTPTTSQLSISSDHGDGESFQRLSGTENDETSSGGNGLLGHNETSENFAASFLVGGSNAGSGFGTPLISNIVQTPTAPTEAENVTVSADISDDGTLTSTQIIFTLNSGAPDSVAMTQTGGTAYEGTIPAQPAGTEVAYYLKAVDDDNNVTVSANFSYTTTTNPPQINNISQTPPAPSASDEVTILAQIIDSDGTVVSADLLYTINAGAADSVAMTLVSGDVYQGIIPPQGEGSQVAYYIKARDNDGNVGVSATRSYAILGTTTIAEIQSTPSLIGQVVTVEGIVTVGANRLITSRTDAYLQDESGRGINIFSFDPPSDPPHNLLVRGSRLRITGTVAEFNGVTELTEYSIQEISTGNPLPDPLELTTGAANDISLEGTYLQINGVVTSFQDFGDAANITLDDGSGEVLIRVWATTGIDLSIVTVDDSLEVRAVMDIFNSAAQLVPAYQDQISAPGAQPGDGSGVATIAPDSVGVGESVSLAVTVAGESGFTLERVAVRIPTEWDWVALPSNVQLSGGGFSGATVAVSGNEITVSNAVVSDIATGQMTIAGLTAPAYGIFTTFTVRTAVAEGSLSAIAGSPVVKVGEGAPAGVTPIAQIQDNVGAFLNQEVTIEGVITIGAGIINTGRVDAYIQDNSGKGINVFSFDPPNPAANINRFTRLRMTGTITEFGGVTEITEYTTSLVAENQPLPTPLFVSSVIANDLAFEGTYMKVVGVVTSIDPDADDNDTNITLRDDQGTVLVRVWKETGISLDFLSVGDTLSVQGVMDVFSSQAQIVPGYADELVVPGKTARADGSGFAFTSAAVVDTTDTLSNFTVFIVGTVDEPVSDIRIDLPVRWQWSGDAADVSLSGGGFGESTSAEAVADPIDEVYRVQVSGATLEQGDTLAVSFNNLRSGPDPVRTALWIRTAGAGGRLRLIGDPPFVSVAGGSRYYIYDLQQNSSAFSGTITVRGITTIGAGLLRKVSSAGDSLTTAYIQDESGRGINLFRFGLIDPALVRGNLVEIRGTVTEFNGVTEIEYTQITELADGLPTPDPISLSNRAANSPRWDGTLVATEGVILESFAAGGGTTLVIGDGEGVTNVRIWDTADLDLSAFEVNNRLLVEGVSGVFISDGDSTYQLLPVYQDQLQLDPNYSPSLAEVSLSVPPHPFAPDLGETIGIRYNTGGVNNQAVLRIFDLGGRLIITLLDESAQIIENTFQWDGYSQLRDRVPLGTYICHLEVIEPLSGKKVTKVVPIVVGTVLSR